MEGPSRDAAASNSHKTAEHVVAVEGLQDRARAGRDGPVRACVQVDEAGEAATAGFGRGTRTGKVAACGRDGRVVAQERIPAVYACRAFGGQPIVSTPSKPKAGKLQSGWSTRTAFSAVLQAG